MKLIAIILFGLSSLAGYGQTIEKTAIPKVIRESSFCIAYEIRDADKREERLVTAGLFGINPDEKIPYIPPNIIVSGGHLDIASLISRTVRQKRLTQEQQTLVNNATFEPKVIYPRMSCHDPHHIFLFYNEYGAPTACLEVCFSCNSIKFADKLLNPKPLPKGESEDFSKDGNWDAPITTGDMLAIAKVCQQLGMELGKFKNLEELQKARKPTKK